MNNNEYQRLYYLRNREYIIARVKNYNKGTKYKEYQHLYYIKNKQKKKDYQLQKRLKIKRDTIEDHLKNINDDIIVTFNA